MKRLTKNWERKQLDYNISYHKVSNNGNVLQCKINVIDDDWNVLKHYGCGYTYNIVFNI